MASITKRGSSYRISVSNGRNSQGKQIIETTTFTPDPNKTDRQNQKTLEKFVIEFEDRVKSGKYLDGEKMTYQDYITIWLRDYAEKQMEQTSYERCVISLNNTILPELGHLRLAKIQPLHIQNLYNKLEKEGYYKNGVRKDYKPSTIKRIHQIISSSLNTAVQWQLIENNPCSRVKPPKPDRTAADIKNFSLEEAQIFLEQLDKEYTIWHGGRQKKDGSPSDRKYETHKIPLQMKIFFHMALFGGFRRGELIALTWNDIDFEQCTVSISKSAARTKDGIIIKQPKNSSSVRVVTLPKDTIKLLKRYKTEQAEYRLSVGSYWKGTNNIFIQDNGQMMDLSTPNHVLKKIINRYNESAKEGQLLPNITLHGLRHTSATLLIAQNIDVRTVSGRLGHAECSTTMNIYAHALKKKDEEAAESLGNLFQKKA